jgi:hypothetical protein
MPEIRHPNGDVTAVPDQLVEYYERQGCERILTPQEIENLKGAKLDQALADKGLPTTGLADEKRELIADAQQTKEN